MPVKQLYTKNLIRSKTISPFLEKLLPCQNVSGIWIIGTARYIGSGEVTKQGKNANVYILAKLPLSFWCSIPIGEESSPLPGIHFPLVLHMLGSAV
jgi:hypothetical protein